MINHLLKFLGRGTFIALILLAGGCAPDHLLVKQADLSELFLHMDEHHTRQDHFVARQLTEQRDTLVAGQQQLLQQADEACRAVEERLQALEEQYKRVLQSTARLERQLGGMPLQNRLRETPGPDLQGPSQMAVHGGKQLVGAVEKVFLAPPGMLLSARIDTGATTSSLNADAVEFFERNGEEWVRFALASPDKDQETVLERKIVRRVRILQANSQEPERRPVVEMGITVGSTTQSAQFTLSDRRHLEHPVLIGRNILLDLFVVDVSRSHIASPLIPKEPSSDKKAP